MKTDIEHFRDWESDVFGYGYGTGEEHIIPAVKLFFDAIPPEGPYDYRNLEAAAGHVVAWLLINLFVKRKIIEYGTSPRFGWLTPVGKRLKQFIDAHSRDELLAMIDYTPDYIPCGSDFCNCGGWVEGKICPNPLLRE